MDQLRNVRTRISKPSDTIPSLVRLTVTVFTMSAATRNSSPSCNAFPMKIFRLQVGVRLPLPDLHKSTEGCIREGNADHRDAQKLESSNDQLNASGNCTQFHVSSAAGIFMAAIRLSGSPDCPYGKRVGRALELRNCQN